MLNDELLATLKQRNRHFNFDLVSGQLAADQPLSGVESVPGQGTFPALRMRNDVLLFPDRDSRPNRPPEDGGGPMKAKAPRGVRGLLFDTVEPQELLVVEGECDFFAALSAGLRGVVCAGGTSALTSNRGRAPRIREGIFKGKDVRIAFDPDEPGRKHAQEVARKLYEAGATRVAIVELPTEGEDLEEYLNGFDGPDLALGALLRRMGAAPWLQPEDLRAEQLQQKPVPVQSERIYLEGAPHPVLVCMTWEPQGRKAGLAVYAPTDLPEPEVEGGEQYRSRPPQQAPSGPWAWHVCDEWSHQGTTYIPDTSPNALKMVHTGALVLTPPPHEGDDTSEALFRDVVAFLKRWVLLPDERHHAVLTAYVLMTWRLHDAQFQVAPILRISGQPGSGKGRLMKCLKELCWRVFAGQTTPDNVHWLVEKFGDVTQLHDEFHTGRGRSREAQERVVDVLNFGFERDGTVLRIINNELETFSVFGARVLAGYSHDEHEGLARRTVAIRMADSPDVPEAMDLPALPARFYQEGTALRARLLAWRGRKLHLGLPNPEGERYRVLRRHVGREVAQAWWALTEMVPAVLEEELDAVVSMAKERAVAVDATRAADLTAYLLAEVARLIEAGHALEQRDGQSWVIPTRMLVEQTNDPRVNVTMVPAILGPNGAGLAHGEFRLAESEGMTKARGFKVPKRSADVVGMMRRHGISWPPEKRKEGAL